MVITPAHPAGNDRWEYCNAVPASVTLQVLMRRVVVVRVVVASFALLDSKLLCAEVVQ